MTTDHIALRCGESTLTEPQLQAEIRRLRAEQAGIAPGRLKLPGRIELVLERDPVLALTTALAVREAGGVPLLGDDRWDAEYRQSARRMADGLAPAPDAAWATLSSGSTGAPRVIVRSHESWASSFPALTRLLSLTRDDVVYLPSPLASSVSVFSAVYARSVGATVLLSRTRTVSDADLAWATVLHGTPQALRTVAERAECGVAHRLRLALIGGAHLDPALRERAEAVGLTVISYYGAAELSFVAVDVDGRGLRPFPGVEVKVEDRELWVRSPFFASGYLDGAAGSFRTDRDGWGTVGDLVEIDGSSGGAWPALRLRGRRDGAILTAAATVIPEDVEAALREIEGIDDAVVFGIPHPIIGALVGAVLEPSPGQPVPSLDAVRRDARNRLASSHLPRRWYWTAQLPRTASGKPSRAEIRRAALDGEVARLV